MQLGEWILEGNAGSGVLTLENDPATGKIFVRVGGRAVAPALTPGETQRVFSWGGNDYGLRIVGGEWDLQLLRAAEVKSGAPASANRHATPLVTASGVSGGAIVKTIIAIAVIALLVPAVRYITRWTAPWVNYDKDPRFAVSFPAEPEKKGSGQHVSLLAVHPTLPQTFEFSYVQVPYALDSQAADQILDSAIKAYLHKHDGTLTKKETGYFSAGVFAGRNDALTFEAKLDSSDEFENGAHVRAIAVYQGDRIYVAALTSADEIGGSPEATRFFGSINIPVHRSSSPPPPAAPPS